MSVFYESRSEKSEYERVTDLDFPLHLHREGEFFTVLDGEIVLLLDGERVTMGAGECALIPPNCIHGCEKTTGSHTLVFFFGGEFLARGEAALMLRTAEIKFPRSALGECGRAALNLIEKRSETRLRYSGVDRGLMYTLLADMTENLAFVERERADGIVEQCLLYLDEHYAEPVDEASLARALGVSRYYVSHVFSDVLHVSFRDFLNLRRAEKARSLLLGSDAAITEIAFEAGFSCIRTFNRAFLAYCGLSPSEFRRRNRQQFLSDK